MSGSASSSTKRDLNGDQLGADMFPPNHHRKGNHRRPPPTLARTNKYRTICDLPVELLDMIISHVKWDRRTVWTCTLVCHCLRAVSLEHYFDVCLTALQLSSLDHLLSFLAANPKICANILRLLISGERRKVQKDQFLPCTPLDDTTVLRLMRLLPHVKILNFRNFVHDHPQEFAPQPIPSAEQEASGPFHLHRLTLGSGSDVLPHKCSIPGLFRILSLFVIGELRIEWAKHKLEPSGPLNLAYLYRPLKVENLHIDLQSAGRDRIPTHAYLKAFTESMQPGALRTLDIRYHTARDVVAIGKLLARAGEGLTSLTLRPDVPYDASERKRWKDPLDSTWLRVSEGD